jgi:chitosanase
LFTNFDRLKGASNPSALGGLARLGITATLSNGILVFSSSDTSGNTSSKLCKAIGALGTDPQWRAAVWQTAYTDYIQPSVQYAHQRGFTSAASIGSFFDTALNEGNDSGDKDGLQGLIAQVGSYTNEADFMNQFFTLRLKIVNTNDYNQSPNGTMRVKQWQQLYTDGFTSLINADAEVLKVTNWQLK